MIKSVMPLFVFFSSIVVLSFTAAKLIEQDLGKTSLFDKPSTCHECGHFMWSGPHVHLCAKTVDS